MDTEKKIMENKKEPCYDFCPKGKDVKECFFYKVWRGYDEDKTKRD